MVRDGRAGRPVVFSLFTFYLNDLNFQKIWALCDLTMSLLISKSTTFELKDFPTDPSVSTMFFVPHEDPDYRNVANYLPPELVVQPPKKLGISVQYLQAAPAAAKKKKVSHTYVYNLTR